MQSNNPFRRVLYAILYLSHLIKRVPKFDECYELYMKMRLYTGVNSGQEINKRKDRYIKAVSLVEKDPEGGADDDAEQDPPVKIALPHGRRS